jgi:hypothetical protein
LSHALVGSAGRINANWINGAGWNPRPAFVNAIMKLYCYFRRFYINYVIDVSWDETAGVWCAVCDDIPLALESNSFDALIVKVKIASYATLEANGQTTDNIRLCFKAIHWESIA